MGLITIKDMNLGISSNPDPSAIPEGSIADGYGFDLTKEGSLRTAGGLSNHDLTGLIPNGDLQWIDELYIGAERYVLVTTSSGLYANGELLSSTFTGRFKGVSFGNQIYLVNGSYAKRFDGSNLYNWGIEAPGSVPTIAPGTHLETAIDDCETLADWIANEVDCTVAADAVDFVEGTQSMKITVAATTIGYSYVAESLDLSKFDTGEDSADDDYVAFWVKVDDLTKLNYMSLVFDGGDGSFMYDTFSYDIVSPQDALGTLQSLGVGKTSEVVTEDTTTTEGITYGQYDPETMWVEQIPTTTITVTKNTTTTLIDPILQDQMFSFWRRNDLFELKSDEWQEVRIPKSLFIAKGDPSWSAVAAIKIIVVSLADTVIVNVDDLRVIGGSDLSGDYWFTWTYSRNDSNGNIIHESSPARLNSQMVISGPVTFDREPVAYSRRGLSADTQVNGGNLYAVGGMLGDFWLVGSIAENTSRTGTVSGVSQKNALRTLNSKHNFPAPPGSDIVVFKNKIWMVGDLNYPQLVRTSDILSDGTLCPEGWPTRNGYLPDGNTGELDNIDLLNQVITVKGSAGEWVMDTTDATDYLQVTAKQVSDNGLLSQDAMVKMATSHIYPTNAGFVESSGQSTATVFPELHNLITTGMLNGQGVSAGLISYFTYYNNNYGPRTAKIDLFRGKPRFMNLNNKLFDRLFLSQAGKFYGILDGQLCLIDSGSEDVTTGSGELDCFIKSRTYQLDRKVGWNWIYFAHDTGDQWYILRIYIDGVMIWAEPFKSTSRTEQYFRFNASSGYELYFTITGTYTTPGTIYFPVRISYGGE